MSGNRARIPVSTLCLVLCLVLGCALRFAGLTRGDSFFVLPGPDQSAAGRAFYHFHPDETTLVQAALNPIDPFAPELTSYGTLPVYLLRGVLELNRIVLGRDFKNQKSPHDVRYVYITAHILAALVSCLTLYLVWLAGIRWSASDRAARCLHRCRSPAGDPARPFPYRRRAVRSAGPGGGSRPFECTRKG